MRERRTARLVAAVALTCAAAAGAVGCGGGGGGGGAKASTAETFKHSYSAQRTALNAVAADIGTVIAGADGKSDAAIEADLRRVQSRYHALLAKLETLKPAAAQEPDFAAVTTAAKTVDADLLRIAAAAAAHDAGGAQAATQQLVAHGATLRSATTRLGKLLGLPPTADTAGPPAPTTNGGTIHVVYDPPADADARVAKSILRLGGTDGVAAGLSHSFVLPADMTIHVVDGFVGPNYDPQTKTITLSYGFVNYVGEQLSKNFPALRSDKEELGRELAAIDGFVLLHEFGHALIDVYDLPVLGREEDAADSVATVFLTQTVTNGAEYAFDAAKFFDALSARQRRLAPSDYWDEHSLDKQRAYSIVCWIGGSGEDAFARVRSLGILPEARLQRCPSEYRQKVRSWDALLQPHVR